MWKTFLIIQNFGAFRYFRLWESGITVSSRLQGYVSVKDIARLNGTGAIAGKFSTGTKSIRMLGSFRSQQAKFW